MQRSRKQKLGCSHVRIRTIRKDSTSTVLGMIALRFVFYFLLSPSHQDHHIFRRGPHVSPVDPWPMALISAIFASDNDQEISGYLSTILSHTSGLGLIHESVDIHLDGVYTRPWFAWAKYVDSINIIALSGTQRLTWLNFVTVRISRR